MAVTGLVSILAGILLSTLSFAKTKAVQVHCSSNMKQLGLALLMYADEYGGWLPEAAAKATQERASWHQRIQTQLGNTMRVAVCPADEHARERVKTRATSYVLNEFTSVDQRDNDRQVVETFRNVDRLKQPAGTMILFVASHSASAALTQEYAPSRRWLNGWKLVVEDIDPERHRFCGHGDNRPRGGSNYLFADAHVEAIAAGRLKARIDRGENFARPPF